MERDDRIRRFLDLFLEEAEKRHPGFADLVEQAVSRRKNIPAPAEAASTGVRLLWLCDGENCGNVSSAGGVCRCCGGTYELWERACTTEAAEPG